MKPVNLGGRIVNNWLFSAPGGYVLVDTGYEDGFPALCRGLDRRGLSPADLSYVFLTHAHDDHAGFLNQLLHRSGVKAILSPRAADGLKRGRNSFEGGCAGRQALFFCKLMALAGKGEHRFPPVEGAFADRLLFADEASKPALGRILGGRILETPGHTDCSISLLLEDGTLFCGDAAMNGLPSLRRTTIWVGDKAAYRRSWEEIIALEPAGIYPGHGAPFPAADLARYLPSLEGLKLYPL